jgi:hypothetical protein
MTNFFKGIVRLSFETGRKGRRCAGELYWRKRELEGKDPVRDFFVADSPMFACGIR